MGQRGGRRVFPGAGSDGARTAPLGIGQIFSVTQVFLAMLRRVIGPRIVRRQTARISAMTARGRDGPARRRLDG
jgi:hypothetical protein